MADLSIDKISLKDFQAVLSRYAETVPSKLHDLDEQRYGTIPDQLSQREATKRCIGRDGLSTLVKWKLSHGKWRPKLQALAEENSEEAVTEASQKGFQEAAHGDIAKAIKTLSTLRGIGPATASLVLSICDPRAIPFFSDELFRWCLWEDKTGSRWDRSIKYNAKEYVALKEKLDELRNRLDVSATDCEKVAYVLGTTEVDLAQAPIAEALEPQGSPPGRKKIVRKQDEKPVVPKKRAAETQDDQKSAKARRSTRNKS